MSDKPEPQRVIITGVDMTFRQWVDLMLTVTFATLVAVGVLALVLGVIYFVLRLFL